MIINLIQFFKILSDESKFKIIKYLMKGEKCVCTIAQDLSMEQSLVSHHINTLRKAGLIINRKVGSWVHCSLDVALFQKLENLFMNELSSGKIINKKCTDHLACCELSKKI